MERKCKAVIRKMSFPLDGKLNYDVQLWYSWHDTFVYAGYGKYFETKEQAEKYAIEHSDTSVIKDY